MGVAGRKGGGGGCDRVLFCVFFFLFAKRSRLGRRPNEPKPAGKSVVHQLARRCHHPFSIRAHLFPRKACATPPTPPPAAPSQLCSTMWRNTAWDDGRRHAAFPRWRPKMGRFAPFDCAGLYESEGLCGRKAWRPKTVYACFFIYPSKCGLYKHKELNWQHETHSCMKSWFSLMWKLERWRKLSAWALFNDAACPFWAILEVL